MFQKDFFQLHVLFHCFLLMIVIYYSNKIAGLPVRCFLHLCVQFCSALYLYFSVSFFIILCARIVLNTFIAYTVNVVFSQTLSFFSCIKIFFCCPQLSILLSTFSSCMRQRYCVTSEGEDVIRRYIGVTVRNKTSEVGYGVTAMMRMNWNGS